MNTFQRHVPRYIDCDRPLPVEQFESTEQLLALDIVQRWTQHPGFCFFAKAEDHLMAIFDKGYSWWVVGKLGDATRVNLPEWDGGYWKVKFSNGDIEEIHGNLVLSSCGDKVTLKDGRVGINCKKDNT